MHYNSLQSPVYTYYLYLYIYILIVIYVHNIAEYHMLDKQKATHNVLKGQKKNSSRMYISHAWNHKDALQEGSSSRELEVEDDKQAHFALRIPG